MGSTAHPNESARHSRSAIEKFRPHCATPLLPQVAGKQQCNQRNDQQCQVVEVPYGRAPCVLKARCKRKRGDPGHLPPLSGAHGDERHREKNQYADRPGHGSKAFAEAPRPREQHCEHHRQRSEDGKDLQQTSGDAKKAEQPQAVSPTVLQPLHEKCRTERRAQRRQLVGTRVQRLFDQERVRGGKDCGDDAAPSTADSQAN